MDTSKPILGALFNKQIRYVVPVFQRHYVWTEEYQWKPLWEDIQNKINARIRKQKIFPHYTGSIVLNQEIVTTDVLSTYSVIDGQQRLTTFQLFLIAFREVCRKFQSNAETSTESINAINELIFNKKTIGISSYDKQKYKIVPTKFDVSIFKDVADLTYEEVDEKYLQPILSEKGIGQKTYRDIAKERFPMLGAYLYFYDELTMFVEERESEVTIDEMVTYIYLSIQNDFQFVEIGLSPSDDPQMIFETLNGRGASLTETDLIRNYIFMRADTKGEDLDRIYELYWDELDDPKALYQWHNEMSRGRHKETRLQFFFIDYLIVKLKEEIRNDQLFYRYKSFIINNEPFASTEEELKEIYKYKEIFKKLTKPGDSTALEKFAKRLLAFGTTTIFPLLMFVEGNENITAQEKEKIYLALDSYVTRRFLCGYTAKNYNNVFLDFINYLNSEFQKENIDNISEKFIEYIKSKTKDTNIWPDNHILKENVLNRPIYLEVKGRSQALVNVFLEIEYTSRGKKTETTKIETKNLTIEHVMPQKWFEHWPLNTRTVTEEEFNQAPQAKWLEEDENGFYHTIEKRNILLNTLGNLTVLTSSLNPSVSNDAFEKKKPEIIKHSTLVLNAYFQNINEWNEEKIVKRSGQLYTKVNEIWPY